MNGTENILIERSLKSERRNHVRSTGLLDPERETTQQESLNELHLFAGGGGGILGGILLGHTCVCAVEIEPHNQKKLLARQRDGILPRFPIWDDVRTFDGKPWRGLVDVVCGGFPCQDISIAGNGDGLDGERSGLWREMQRIIGEIRPKHALVENSPMLVVRGLDRVLGDFSEMGYDARWGLFSAADVGARHERQRCFILADRKGVQNRAHGNHENGCEHCKPAWQFRGNHLRQSQQQSRRNFPELTSEPRVCGTAHAVASHVDRLYTIGNGQVPAVVELAWKTLERGFGV